MSPLVLTARSSIALHDSKKMKGKQRTRLVAVCEDCGSMYAAFELPDGEIRPIGNRKGCASCNGTEFSPLPEFSDKSGESNAD